MLTACLTSSSYSLKQSHRFKEPEPTRRAFASSWRDAISIAGSSEFNQCSASVKKYCQTGVNTDFCHRKPASLSRLTSENFLHISSHVLRVFTTSFTEESVQQHRIVSRATWSHDPHGRARARLQQLQWGWQPQWQLVLGNKTTIIVDSLYVVRSVI